MGHDLIVIGAGLAGLRAASVALSAGFAPLLLEARTRIGGRAFTTASGVDVGCAQIHGFNEGNPVRALLESKGMSAHIVTGANLVIVNENGPLSPADSVALMGTSKAAAYVATFLPPPSSTSLASVLLPTLAASPDLLALARMIEVGAGVPLERLSAKYHGFGRGYAGTDGAPVGGYSKLCDEMLREITDKGGEIILENEVILIEDLGKGKGVRVETRDGSGFVAKACISTLPLGVLKVSPPKFIPPLSTPFLAAVERTQVGVLEKAILNYDSGPWWPEAATTGTFILLPTAPRSSTPTTLAELFAQSPLSVVNLSRTLAVPQSSLLVYLGSTIGSFVSQFPAAEVGAALHLHISTRLNVKSAPPPSLVEMSEWLNDPFARGATSAPITIDTSTVDGGEAASPLDFVILGRSEWEGRLGWAGEHTEIDTRGSVVGAVLSGEREARRVVEMLKIGGK